MGDTAKVLVGDVTVTIDGALGKSGGLKEIGLLPLTGFYTMDGVTLTVRSEFANIKVEENVGTIIRRLTDQDVQVSLNMAEGALANFVAAVPGSFINLAGTGVEIGGGDLQEFELTLVGVSPSGGARTIHLTKVNPIGEVGVPYKKGEASIVPVTFACLVDDYGLFGTKIDA